MDSTFPRFLTLTAALIAASSCAGASAPPPSEASSPPIVQPGAPGQATRTVKAENLDDVVGVDYTSADVRFMRGMIPHHAQALQMTALVRGRAQGEELQDLALRMEISQRDEIALMERWLRNRNEPVEMAGGAMGTTSGMPMMPGMLSPEQMNQLTAATGIEFERLFLEFMIQHHQGAIVMVAELFASSGAGQESEVFQFASEVDADQTIEIERMRRMLVERR